MIEKEYHQSAYIDTVAISVLFEFTILAGTSRPKMLSIPKSIFLINLQPFTHGENLQSNAHINWTFLKMSKCQLSILFMLLIMLRPMKYV